jgi:hypothetical protein
MVLGRYVHDRVQEAFYGMMDKSERIRYHGAAAELYIGEFSQLPQDVLFTIAHHYNVSIAMFEQQIQDGAADQAQIERIVHVYYEAAKVF